MKAGIVDSYKFLINARWSLGTGKKKFFIVFLIGKDRRMEKMSLIQNKRLNISLAKAIIYSGIFAWVFASILMLSFVGLYLVKSYAGVDLVKGSHPFPTFLKKVGLCR